MYIEAALATLKRSPERLRRFVVVEDVVTGRFVQFYGSEERGIYIDLPCATVSSRGHSAAAAFLDRGFNGDGMPERFHKKLDNEQEGARLALRVLREVHDLPDSAELQIEQSGGIEEIT